MTTTVTPATNAVAYAPTIENDTSLLNGHIDAFVEVDLLIWEHKWSVERLNYAGFDGKSYNTVKAPSDCAR